MSGTAALGVTGKFAGKFLAFAMSKKLAEPLGRLRQRISIDDRLGLISTGSSGRS
jgi:hypothetical protein